MGENGEHLVLPGGGPGRHRWGTGLAGGSAAAYLAEYRAALVGHNYRVASRFYSYRVLRDSLRSMINNVRNMTE